MPDSPHYLTIREAAEKLRTTPGALYTQRHRGAAPGALCVRVGGRLLYSAEALDAWYSEQLAAGGAAGPWR